MELLYKSKKLKEGYNLIVSSKNSPLRLLEFGRLTLSKKGSKFSNNTGDKEVVLDIFGGRCDVQVSNGNGGIAYSGTGGRHDIFSGKPTIIYIPKGSEYHVTSLTSWLDIGVFKSPARRDTKPVLVPPDALEVKDVGEANWKRGVCTAIGSNVDADRLIVGETYSLPGNWSSYPPHKHDTKGVHEAPYEEIYFFKVKPCQGFGVQRIYTKKDTKNPVNEVYVVEDGDAVAIPKGYHPVCAGAGYALAYYWALAGEERGYAAWSDDPDHVWLRNCEPILKL